MARTKPAASRPRSPVWILTAWLLQPGIRWATLATVTCAIAAIGGVSLWQRVRIRVLSGDAYQIELDEIQLSAAPAWIRSDVRSEALGRGALDFPLELLDPQLNARIATALESHPWIASVTECRKRHPACVDVAVVYRRPVMMVEVQGGLFPVDVEATLLPCGDFTTESAARYPRLGGIETAPLGPAGSPWGDPRVVSAAGLAAILAEHWTAWGLERIQPLQPVSGLASAMEFEISRTAGATIVWGHAPGTEVPGEASAQSKLASLLSMAKRPGGLGTAPSVIDLRQPMSGPGPQTAVRETSAPR